jgi:phosphatidate cytidylyltransferase
MLWQRLVVAAVGIPILAAALLAPEWVFAAFVEAALALAAYELFRAAVPNSDRVLPVGAAAATALFVAIVRVTDDVPLRWMILALVVVLALLLRPRGARASLNNSAGGWWLAAVLYPGVLGAHLVLLRNIEPGAGPEILGLVADGQRWLIVMLAATWATDAGAYAIGKPFGRHRLWPAVSPGKTWEGTVAGVALGAVVAAVAPLLLGLEPGLPLHAAIVVGIPLAAVLGDLLESAIKRRIGVKDLSGLLPGHGGMLDRIDSWLATSALLYWLLRWFPP